MFAILRLVSFAARKMENPGTSYWYLFVGPFFLLDVLCNGANRRPVDTVTVSGNYELKLEMSSDRSDTS